ncbi:hypothetical protein K438DRAFT_1984459 [Mycena galopus ATCC 62051]|nr:hypothetical protein K438DRAFT_1984459 [Mycena galopus ATCC 62051]
MSAAGDVIRTANAGSGVFPPLQAAFSLVSYIDQSIALFKSNKNEIKAIGLYSQQLSQQLKRHRPANSKGTEDFGKVISDIHEYVRQLTKKNPLVQYFQRQPITNRLQDYRNQLREQFDLFSITSDIDIQEAHRAAEEARQADRATMQVMQEEIRKFSSQITTSPIGVSQFAAKYGLSKTQPSAGDVCKELEEIPEEGGHRKKPQCCKRVSS